MSYAITDNRAWAPLEIMVSAATIAKASAEIDADLGAVYAPGTIIYTAGYTKIKQKGLDGSWAEVTA